MNHLHIYGGHVGGSIAFSVHTRSGCNKNKALRKTYTTILAIFFCRLLFAQFQPLSFPTDTIFTRAEQMPYFTGCEPFTGDTLSKRQCSDRELSRFISRHLTYPDVARYQGIEGTVLVSFVIDEQGRVTAPSVLMDIGGGCGQSALDVIREMPLWEPAIHGGQTVKVRLNIPIQFFLRAEDRDRSERYRLTWGRLRGDTVSKRELNDNLSHKVYVRSPEGSKCYIDELEFIFEKENRIIRAASRGDINEELKKVASRIKRDGTLTIRASIQENGEFATVTRTFQVVK